MAADSVILRYRYQFGLFPGRATLAVLAAGFKGADRGHINKVGGHTQDRDQLPAPRLIQARDRPEQTYCVRVKGIAENITSDHVTPLLITEVDS